MTDISHGLDSSASPDHECDICGACYYGRGAALTCCGRVLADGGQPPTDASALPMPCPQCDAMLESRDDAMVHALAHANDSEEVVR